MTCLRALSNGSLLNKLTPNILSTLFQHNWELAKSLVQPQQANLKKIFSINDGIKYLYDNNVLFTVNAISPFEFMYWDENKANGASFSPSFSSSKFKIKPFANSSSVS